MRNVQMTMILMSLLLSSKLYGQQVFVPYGRISYEKKINMQRSLAGLDIPDQALAQMEKYNISNWELLFNTKAALYRMQKTDNGRQKSELYTHYDKNSRIIKRNIFDEFYLLTDSIPHTDWKITHDVRTIAGYECRKAITRISDTVYVVAFYTEEILPAGGPEGFTGLPGMILGLAIPRYNTTWFATKVEAFSSQATQISSPTGGKKVETDKEKQKLIEVVTRFFPDRKEKTEEAKRFLYGFTL